MIGVSALGAAVIMLASLAPVPVASADPGVRGGVSPGGASSVVGFWAGERFLGEGGPSGYPARAADYWADRDLSMWTPELWAMLQRHRVPIYFHLRYGRDFGAVPHGRLEGDALPIIRRANQLGVPVFAWVAVPYEDGYWATQDNAPAQLTATTALTEWVRDNHLDIAGVAYDMEPPVDSINALVAGRMDAVEQTRFIDPAAQCRAIEQYDAVYNYAREHFGRVVGAPVPFVLDDLANGDLALQNALGLWGLPRGAQTLYFQAYRSTVAEVMGADPGPGLIAHYAQQARQVGAERGQLTLGIAGDGVYRELNTLVDDVRLARALGATSIPIYSLETAVAAYGVDGVERLVRAGENPLDDTGVRAAQNPTPQLVQYLTITNSLDTAATLATPAVTAATGRFAQPNRSSRPCDTANEPVADGIAALDLPGAEAVRIPVQSAVDR
ncbi:hypothetical protein [Nocardia arthritidis]|uniref:Uncharacterized protein n=1 Tax=Nocardia arthritidis TaxID=228602 RepID=A0A6G9YPI8_9NOCA|nr:hypothetical protein [Nocardia arthritidis]QIS14936.1 hypothetical protein F5544_35525 [Nocardia arthritidis]